MKSAKKCRALGCNRMTRTPFCFQHADMRDRGIKFGSVRHKNIMDEFCKKLNLR